MGNWFTSLFTSISPRKKDEDGYYPLFYNLFNASPEFNDYASDQQKVNIILSNPAVLKVFKLQCDLFSLGKIYVYKGEDEVKDDVVLKMFGSPNAMQSQSQLLWDYMFWLMTGTAYLYMDSNIPSENNILYLLDPSKMEWPSEMDEVKDRLILSDRTKKNIEKTLIKYRYEDGTEINIPLSKIISLTDLSNGFGNWFKGRSTLDALSKVIDNSEAALDAENINLRYSGKFMVAGMADRDNVSSVIMGEDEKNDIEKKVNGPKSVFAIKSKIDVKRFVEDIASLKLSDAYLNAYYIIGNMYNIPRDVLEAYNKDGATFENQEKATAKHVSYCLEPKGEDLMRSISSRIGYTAAGKEIVISWDHLPFMQVMEADRVKVQKQKADTFCLLLDQGVELDEVNQFLDTNFKTGKANAKPTTQINTAN